MATLQKIRNRAGLLVAVVIGLALFAFILGDMLGSGASVFKKRSVAEINGRAVDVEEYLAHQNQLREFYQLNYGNQSLDPEIEQQIQTETWSRMVRQNIMDQAFNQLGIFVSSDELKMMVTGDQGLSGNMNLSQPHPIIRQMFSNPETGQLNRTLMTNYFNALDNPQFAQEKKRWLFIEQEIINERMNEKYFNLVRKGFQPSTLDLKDYAEENGKSVDFAYISKNYASVPDEEITIAEADLKQYYKEHRESFRQEASRTFQYVVFDVEPSEKDHQNALYWAEQTKAEFSRIESGEVIRYVNSVSDEPAFERYFSYNELPENIRDSVFYAEIDYIHGPYLDGESYKLTRVNQIQQRPDSVRARHILLSYSDYGNDRNRLRSMADSLKNVLENRGDFTALAAQYSGDESNRAIGGDLGWFTEGTMVQEFSNACFENKTGDIVLAETDFGQHIIKIENQSREVKKIQLATIVRNIIASDETNQDYYNRAVKFRGKATNLEKFDEQVREFGLDPRVAPNITKDQTSVPGLEDPLRIIKWAFSSEVNNVSNIFSMNDDKYVVAVLTGATEDGYADIEDVRTEIETAVKKQKKADVLVSRLKEQLEGVSTLAEYGTAHDENVGEATRVRFANTYVPGIGMEPYVVGAAMYLPVEKLSEPLTGENGVFVISVVNREEPASINLAEAETRLKYALESRSNYEAYNALLEEANLKDYRLDIFYN
ncbi:MAG: peptidylprolyl isomerase [Bacteroidales bacterium]|nr:peptidylprolyl isomerase [Bacteroidales bacterium]MBN2699726.1 peptidylprolyl isomerase [Bacteroidales bacterium]